MVFLFNYFMLANRFESLFSFKNLTLDFVAQLSWYEWIAYSFAINVLLFLFSIAVYILIDKTCPKVVLQKENQPILSSDIKQCSWTIVCNVLVMLGGVFLWKENIIGLANASFWGILFQVVLLVLLMDLLMYGFHRLAHIPFIYDILHQKHHQHTSTNYLSLFVLHPLETIGFGCMILVILTVYDFSPIAITIYLFINLLWGTIGHLNKEFFPKKWRKLYIGTSKFHNDHHLHEKTNFGFYTSIWDHLLGTYKKQ